MNEDGNPLLDKNSHPIPATAQVAFASQEYITMYREFKRTIDVALTKAFELSGFFRDQPG